MEDNYKMCITVQRVYICVGVKVNENWIARFITIEKNEILNYSGLK